MNNLENKISNNLIKNIIAGLRSTYFGVLLSIELNRKTSQISMVIKKKLENLITNNQDKIESQITLGVKQVGITLKKVKAGEYNVKFSGKTSLLLDIKNIKDYNLEDLLTLCIQHDLTIHKDDKGRHHYSITIRGQAKSITIGGPGKISIFPQHLSYVKDIIEHLEEGKIPIQELASAKGSGKTYIELLIQYLPTKLMGITFLSLTTNKSLAKQKLVDWKKVLSDLDTDDIELEEITSSKVCSILSYSYMIEHWNELLAAIGLKQLPNIIKALKIEKKEFQIINGKLLIDAKNFVILDDKIKYADKEYEIKNGKVTIDGKEFEINIRKSISLCFDEEHCAAKQELYKYRMKILSSLFPTLFLSSTPSTTISRHTQKSGGLLKTLPSQDKMQSGSQGTLELQVNINLTSKFLSKEYIDVLQEYVHIRQEKNNTYSRKNFTDDELEREVDNYLYRNVKSVIGEPALILSESDKELRVLKTILHLDEHEIITMNLNNSPIIVFLINLIVDLLKYKPLTKSQRFSTITEEVAKQFNITKEKASEIIKQHYDFSGVAAYSSFRVMHGLIENTLLYLTDLNRQELDERRYDDFNNLVEEVTEILNDIDNNFEKSKHALEKYIENQGIENEKLKKEIAKSMQHIVNVLIYNKNSVLFIRLIRNWNQDRKLHLLMPPKCLHDIPDNIARLLKNGWKDMAKDYLEHLGVEKNKIIDFLSLEKKARNESNTYLKKELREQLLKKIRGELGIIVRSREFEIDKAKYPLLKLRDFCDTYKVKNKESDSLSTSDYSKLCLMGLIGNSMDKAQGYNDINLQHVTVLIDPTCKYLNTPKQLIQAPGRLRCLNPNRHSVFFCYSNTELNFDINLLKKGSYIESYNESVAKLLNDSQTHGDKLAKQIISHIDTEIDKLEGIEDLLDNSLRIVLEKFIGIYNINEHDYNKTKKIFIDTLKHAQKNLYSYEKERKTEIRKSISSSRLYYIVILVYYLYNRFIYYLQTRSIYNNFLQVVDKLKKASPNVSVYARIIAEYSIKNVEEINLLFDEFLKICKILESPKSENDIKSLNDYLENINDSLKHPVSLKLFDKIISPLMKGDYLIKLLNKIYPEQNNQIKVEELKIFRKKIRSKSFEITKSNFKNMRKIFSYVKDIFKIIKKISCNYHGLENYNVMKKLCHNYYRLEDDYEPQNHDVSAESEYIKDDTILSFIPPELLEYIINSQSNIEENIQLRKARHNYMTLQKLMASINCKSDIVELEILSKKKNIKLVKESAKYILSPLIDPYYQPKKNIRLSEDAKKIRETVVSKTKEFKNTLENQVKPFSAGEIFSPNTKFPNPILKLFPELLIEKPNCSRKRTQLIL